MCLYEMSPNSRPLRHRPLEPEIAQVQFLDIEIDDTDQVNLADPVFKPLQKQRNLFWAYAFNESGHACSRLFFSAYLGSEFSHSLGSKPTCGCAAGRA
jgi:hypothetical protein